MEVFVRANDMVYNTTKPWYNADLDKLDAFEAGGKTWQRLRQFDRDPQPGGVFARVFRMEPDSGTVVIAFKGICVERGLEQCIMDWCFLSKAQSYGALSTDMSTMFGASPEICQKYQGQLNFTDQADDLVRQVQRALPKHSITLTGHSMGGLLSMVTAARQSKVLKAMTFAPTPFHHIMNDEVKLSDKEIQSLNSDNLVATCDAFDCGINSLYVKQARIGAKTCLYVNEEEPSSCQGMAAEPYESVGWRQKLKTDPSQGMLKALPNLMCKQSAHEWWLRYSKLVLRRRADGSPANLPVCSTAYSVLTVQ
eukprot:Skav208658  [mRNA]  locus=scaffold357:126691:127617:- [translate_table: standard]